MNVILLRDKLDTDKNILISLRKRVKSKVLMECKDHGHHELKEGDDDNPAAADENLEDHDSVIVGAKWMSSSSKDRIEIDTVDILGKSFNLKSDIAETLYSIYYDKDKPSEKRALHVQTTLTNKLREQKKSDWQRSIHIIESMAMNNGCL